MPSGGFFHGMVLLREGNGGRKANIQKSSMTPAQLTRMSSAPQCWSTLFTAASTSLSDETSHLIWSSLEAAFSPAAAAPCAEKEMSSEATLAPCSVKRLTIAWPIPALPPVTIATYVSTGSMLAITQ